MLVVSVIITTGIVVPNTAVRMQYFRPEEKNKYSNGQMTKVYYDFISNDY